MMTFLLKHPDATLDYAVDWGADYLSGETLSSSDWSASPDEPGGVTLASSAFDSLVATATVSGGKAGSIYRLTNHVTTSDGRDDSRSIMLRVEKR
ncbi:MAG: hypothetical protein ABIN83_01000 [Sphingomicrobium sp.]